MPGTELSAVCLLHVSYCTVSFMPSIPPALYAYEAASLPPLGLQQQPQETLHCDPVTADGLCQDSGSVPSRADLPWVPVDQNAWLCPWAEKAVDRLWAGGYHNLIF